MRLLLISLSLTQDDSSGDDTSPSCHRRRHNHHLVWGMGVLHGINTTVNTRGNMSSAILHRTADCDVMLVPEYFHKISFISVIVR